jgi:ketosteroid isomerase-like protein
MSAEERARIDRGVRELYDAFASGDPDRYRSRFAEDFTWHVPGDNPVSGPYRGHHEYFEVMTSRMAPLEEWTFELGDIMVNERARAAVVELTVRGLRAGVSLEVDGCHVIRLDEQGRVIEGWGFLKDQDALDRFFLA